MKNQTRKSKDYEEEIDSLKHTLSKLKIKEKLAEDHYKESYKKHNEKTKIKSKFPLKYDTFEATNPTINMSDEEEERYCCGFFKKKIKTRTNYKFDELRLSYKNFKNSSDRYSGNSALSEDSVESAKSLN